MKKILIVATAALCFAGNLSAQETAGGAAATTTAVGTITAPVIVAATVGLGIAGAVVANNRGSTTPVTPVDPPGPVDPTCNGTDPLVDGVCTGTTTTVTGTGTGTTTVTVPVTFTYMPTT